MLNLTKTFFCFLLALLLIVGSAGKASAQCHASFTSSITSGCEPLTIQFNGTSSGAVQNNLWNFGDGSNNVTGSNPPHTFSAGVAGDTTYTVVLTTNCIGGGSSTASATVKVYKLPTVKFTVSKTSVCAITDSVCFTNLSTTGAGFTYNWNFSDSHGSSETNPCHTYSTGGTYVPELQVTSPIGCINSSLTLPNQISLNVISPPSANFSVSPLLSCGPTTVNIADSSAINASSHISNYNWTFGDGSVSTSPNNTLQHLYTTPGTYFITLQTKNSLGCSNTTKEAIVIRTLPNSNFTSGLNSCLDAAITAQASGTATNSPSAQYQWTANGATVAASSNIPGPVNIKWATAGLKSIYLTVTDSACVDSTAAKVTIYPNLPVNVKSVPSDTFCSNQTISIEATPVNYLDYTFLVNGTAVQTGTNSKLLNKAFNNLDQVTVVATDFNGCLDSSITKTMVVNPAPGAVLTPVSSTTFCSGKSVTFSATPAGLKAYNFYDGGKLLQSGTSNTFTISNVLVPTTITLKDSNNFCISSASNTIQLDPVVQITKPLVNCGITTTSTVDFTWDSVPGATGYQVSINSGAYMTPSSGSNGLDQLISGLALKTAVSIRVRAIGGSPCLDTTYSATKQCATTSGSKTNSDSTSTSCNPLSFTYSSNLEACVGTSLDLPIKKIASAHYGISWNGGPYSTSWETNLTVTKDTVIQFAIIDSTQLVCGSYAGAFNVTALPTPVVSLTSNYSLGDSVCADALVTFTATPNNLTSYTFYDGSNQLQTGGSNIYSTRALSGTNAILVVGKLGSCSATSNNSLPIHLPLAAVPEPTQVTCGASTSSAVSFNWDAMAGATGYKISINGGPYLTPTSGNLGTTHLVQNLSSNEAVTASVQTLLNGTCSYSPISVPIACYTESCPNIDFTGNFSPDNICQGDSITLSIKNISIKNYTVTWPGMSPSAQTSFTFAPQRDTIVLVAVPSTGVTSCQPTTKYFVVKVNAKPQLKLTSSLLGDTVCAGAAITFSASPAGLDQYKFYDNYALVQTSNSEVYTTTDIRDAHFISVVATEGGCTDSVGLLFNKVKTTVITPLQTPEVNCGLITADTIQFDWTEVPGALGYQVSIDNGPWTAPTSGKLGLTNTISGLTLGTVKTLAVVALGNAPCGNSIVSSAKTCQTLTDTSSSGGGGGHPKRCLDFSYSMAPGQAKSVCFGDSITLKVQNITAKKPLLTWNFGLGGNDTTYRIKVTQDTLIYFTLIDTSQSLACPAKVNEFVVNVVQLPAVNLLTSARGDSLCSNVPIQLIGSPQTYDDYKFYNNGVLIQDSAYPVATINTLSAGNALRVVSVNQGCVDSSTVHNITLLPLPVVSLTSNLPASDSICFGDTIVLTANPSNLSRYQFYNNITYVQLLQDSTIATLKYPFLPAGAANVITVVGANNRCSSLASNAIKPFVISQPTVSLSSSAVGNQVCSGSPVTFTANPGNYAAYLFYDRQALMQSSISPTYTTKSLKNGDTILVQAISKFTCHSIFASIPGSAILVDSVPNPSIAASYSGGSGGICVVANDTVTLTGSVNTSLYPNCTYQWGDGRNLLTETFSPRHTTEYYFTATYKNCPWTDSIEVHVDSLAAPVPVITSVSGETAKICIKDSFLLEGSGGMSYLWTPVKGQSIIRSANSQSTYVKADTSRVHANDTLVFNLKVTNIYCSASLSASNNFNLYIDLCLKDLPEPIPTLITPNGDNLNDVWFLTDIDYFTSNSVQIFNRWGEQVYSESPYKNNWGGTNQAGEKLPDGIYYYILNLGNGIKTKSGYIVVNR